MTWEASYLASRFINAMAGLALRLGARIENFGWERCFVAALALGALGSVSQFFFLAAAFVFLVGIIVGLLGVFWDIGEKTPPFYDVPLPLSKARRAKVRDSAQFSIFMVLVIAPILGFLMGHIGQELLVREASDVGRLVDTSSEPVQNGAGVS